MKPTVYHRHSAKPGGVRYVPYRGTARGTRRPNSRAHGWETCIETCRCGATREVNTNRGHEERGAWYGAED